MAEQAEETNDERRTRIRQFLNELIRQDVIMKEAVNNARESFKEWQAYESALTNSNDKLLLELKNLQAENASLAQKIRSKTDTNRKLDGEFKEYEEINNMKDEKFWKSCVAEMDEYRNLFTQAEVEYNTNSLKKDIVRYREISEDVIGKIARTNGEMSHLTDIHGSTELGTNEMANSLRDLRKFQKILMENDKSRSLSIRSAENELQKLNSKLRQKKRDTGDISRKTKR